MVEATGATLLSSLSESEVSDPTKTKVIMSDPSTPAFGEGRQKSYKAGSEAVPGYLAVSCHHNSIFFN